MQDTSEGGRGYTITRTEMPHVGFYPWGSKGSPQRFIGIRKNIDILIHQNPNKAGSNPRLHILLWSFATFNHYAYHLR